MDAIGLVSGHFLSVPDHRSRHFFSTKDPHS
jgi:hypothetical protein